MISEFVEKDGYCYYLPKQIENHLSLRCPTTVVTKCVQTLLNWKSTSARCKVVNRVEHLEGRPAGWMEWQDGQWLVCIVTFSRDVMYCCVVVWLGVKAESILVDPPATRWQTVEPQQLPDWHDPGTRRRRGNPGTHAVQRNILPYMGRSLLVRVALSSHSRQMYTRAAVLQFYCLRVNSIYKFGLIRFCFLLHASFVLINHLVSVALQYGRELTYSSWA